jgi:hypothetical protein
VAVDPKDLAKRNIPLIVIYVLALVPIVVWFVAVSGGVKGGKSGSFKSESAKLAKKRKKIRSMIKKIKDKEQRVYTKKDVTGFKDQHKVYATLIGELKQTLADRDTVLEKWFDDCGDVPEGKTPGANDYITLYEKEVLELGKTYADLITSSDGGPPLVYSQAPSKDQLRLFQKRFWIQKHLLDSLVKGSEAGKANGSGAKIVQAVRFTESNIRTSEPGPKEVVRHDVNVVFTCSARDLPVIVEKILAQPISTQIRSLHMEKEPFVYDDPDTSIHVDGRSGYFADVYYTGELRDHDAFKGDDKQEAYIPEPPVRVTLDYQVLDFDIAKPPPPPAEDEDANLDDEEEPDDKKKKKR